MCGFCGIYARSGTLPDPSGEILDRMTDTMVHRGPDDRGVWRSPEMVLGHRRLAIIDLTPSGRQPMANEDDTVLLVYNGEVYNFRELSKKHDLVGRGHRFRSRTDTEVLLHLYEELGIEMVHQLNGMFALGIWDRREGALYLARDRYGIKPLFYQEDGEHFRFASEIKALLADPRVPRQVSLQALHDFLTFDYIPGPRTAFQDIRRLPPAHWMRVEAGKPPTLHRYWDLPPQAPDPMDERRVTEEARVLMEEAVRARLVADVPVGVLLSGGLDSSTVAALMGQHTKEPVLTFSVGFREESFDERGAAARVSRHLGTVHREVTVTPGAAREILPAALRQIDEPYADGSAIPTWMVSRLARQEVGVVLSGEGGDEVFAGYDTYAAARAAAWARCLPGWLRRGVVAPVVSALPVSHRKLSLEFRLKRFLGGIDLPPEDAHLWWRIVLTEAQKRELYAPWVLEAMEPEEPERHFREVFHRASGDTVNRLLHLDSAIFLPGDLMIKNDRMTMAHSLEARIPFTDPALVEFMARVPGDMKLKGMRRKHIMRKALRGVLPREIIRRKKVGLELPYSAWFAGEWKDLLLEHLGPERVEATGLFRPEAVGELVGEHLDRRRDHGRALWGLMSFMIWHEAYLQ